MRRCLLVLSLGAAATVAASSGAAAAPSSAVTTPAATVVYTYDYDNPGNPANQIPLAGTASTTPVDIICSSISQPSSASLATVTSGVTVTAGAWTASGAPAAALHPCRLRAVPTGTLNSDPLDPFTGPLVLMGRIRHYKSAGLRRYDYYYAASQTEGYADYNSFAGCGLDDMNLVAGEIASDELFYCNDYAYGAVTTPIVPASRSAILVDGKHAYAPASDTADLPGFPALTSNATRDTSNGAISITESDPIVNCTTTPTTTQLSDPACTAATSSGIRLDRTIVQSNNGRTVDFTDRWVSTDGAAHALDLWTEEDHRPSNAAFKVSWSGAGYVSHTAGDTVTPPQDAPATLFVRSNALTDNDFSNPQGSITYGTPPLELKWQGARNLNAHFVRTIPATGQLILRQTYNMALNSAQLEAAANKASSVFSTPTLVVASPTNGATVTTARLTVSGTATDRDAIKNVSVNGQILGVGTGGAFATTVDLAPGANTITIIATSAAGTQTSVTRTVTYTPAAVPKPSAVTVLGSTVIKTKRPKVTIKGTSSGYTKILANRRLATIAADGSWSVTLGVRKGRTSVLIVAGDAPTQTIAQRTIVYNPPKRKKKKTA